MGVMLGCSLQLFAGESVPRADFGSLDAEEVIRILNSSRNLDCIPEQPKLMIEAACLRSSIPVSTASQR